MLAGLGATALRPLPHVLLQPCPRIRQSESCEERDAWIKAVRAAIATLVCEGIVVGSCPAQEEQGVLEGLGNEVRDLGEGVGVIRAHPLLPLCLLVSPVQASEAGGGELAGAGGRKVVSSPMSAVGAPVGAGAGAADGATDGVRPL